jgi:very-short-patch-repair endonuclease
MSGKTVTRARALRKAMTPPEVTLWQHLRMLRAHGWHFRRQAPEPPYILDFVCHRARLVVEVDRGARLPRPWLPTPANAFTPGPAIEGARDGPR